MSIETSELLIQQKESSSTIKVFSEKITLPKKIGYVFGVLEAGHPGQDLLLEHAINQFKNNLPIIAEKIKRSKVDEAFEQVIQDVNQNLTEYIKEKNILLDFDSLNGVIAVLYDKNLYFTYLGKITTFLIHKIGKDNYKIIDILDNISGSAVKPTIFKIFSNVISGQIANEDGLFFSTSNILDFITNDRLKQLIVDNHPIEAIAEIKKLLNKSDKANNVGAVLFNLNTKKTKAEKRTVELEEDEKEEEDVEEETESLEAEKNITTKEEIKNEAQEEEKIIAEEKMESEEDAEKDKIETKLPEPGKVAEKISEKINETKNKFFSLKRLSKILLIIVLVAAIFFIQSLQYKSKQNLTIEQEKKYNETVKIIEDKLTEIDAKLIIDEKDEARQLIKEAETLILRLPENKLTKIDELNKRTKFYLNQIRNITQIDNPTVLAELANPAIHLIKQQDAIYLYNSNNSLYKLDLASNKVKVVANNVEDKGGWNKNAPDVEQGKTLLLYNGSSLSQYDFEANELSAVEIQLADNIQIDDLNFYGQKLYLIDGAASKIYKHIKLTKNSFNSGSSWLLDDTDLSGAVSITIDGNIWVLKSTGEIIKLFKNKKADFKLKTIDPPLNNPTKIYTTLEMDNIYILEPSGNRLVVIDKLGNLLGQYYSPQFDNLLDFVLEKDKEGKETGKVYLLNGLKVFGVEVK